MALPVLYLLVRATAADSVTWGRLLEAETLQVVAASVGLATAVAVAAVGIAVPYAWLVVRTDMPGRRLLAVLGTLPLVLPSYVGALTMIGAFGPRGLLQQLLEPLGVERLPEIYGFWGSWLSLTLFTYPYALLLLIAALARSDISLERAARSLGTGPVRAFMRVTMPQLRPAMAAGGLLCALYALSDFGVVSLMRYNTFTRAIFVQYRSLFDRNGAALLALVLVVVTGLVLIAERRLRGRSDLSARRVRATSASHPVQLGRFRALALAWCLLVVGMALLVPAGVLGWWLFSAGALAEADWGDLLRASRGSLLASGAAAVLAIIIAAPVAAFAARAPSRLSGVVEAWTYAGFALPGVVIALGLVFLATSYALPLYQTLWLLLIAYVARFLPQAVGAIRTSLERVNPRLEAAARGMGLNRLQAFRRVTLPLAAPGVLSGAALVFVTAMKELPATLILRPTGFDTLATEVWTSSTVGRYSQAAVPALLLVLVSAVPLYLLVVRRPAHADDAAGEA